MHMQNYVKVAPATTLPDLSPKRQRKCSTPPKLDTIFEEDDLDVYAHKGNIYLMLTLIWLSTFHFFSRCIAS
ncbi:unnamed protein product [Amaranthus hypochondriacus]